LRGEAKATSCFGHQFATPYARNDPVAEPSLRGEAEATSLRGSLFALATSLLRLMLEMLGLAQASLRGSLFASATSLLRLMLEMLGLAQASLRGSLFASATSLLRLMLTMTGGQSKQAAEAKKRFVAFTTNLNTFKPVDP